MTRFFVRVRIGDRWENREIDELTDDQMREIFEQAPREKLIAWAMAGFGWIRDNVKEAPSAS